MYNLIVLSVVLGAASAGMNKICPVVFGKYPLEGHRMIGKWNVVASTPVRMEGLRCTKLKYQITKDAHIMVVTGLTKEGKPIRGEIYAQPFFGKDNSSSSFMQAVFKMEDGTYSRKTVTL